MRPKFSCGTEHFKETAPFEQITRWRGFSTSGFVVRNAVAGEAAAIASNIHKHADAMEEAMDIKNCRLQKKKKLGRVQL